ncbi:class I SAM-dependent methyltransferase [Brachybacterium avium]|uniref:class I SAM-dependent methyltransferase n=1 Tax=Brachybacterium avium TaxID=2017485 RepID=UPI001560B8D9|nr:methyltransferase [Brachybacterium avium]
MDNGSTAGEDTRRTAIDLGCGLGIEARFLVENGYEVHAYDVDPSVVPALEMLAAELPVHPQIIDLAEIEHLPGADLVLACAALPFLRRDAFDGMWSAVVKALRPGAVLAVDLFGVHDDWATTEGTYLSRAEVERLLEGFEVIELTEEQRDGRSFSGPKHWHTFRVLARCP